MMMATMKTNSGGTSREQRNNRRGLLRLGKPRGVTCNLANKRPVLASASWLFGHPRDTALSSPLFATTTKVLSVLGVSGLDIALVDNDSGTCKPGETAASTGCTPASSKGSTSFSSREEGSAGGSATSKPGSASASAGTRSVLHRVRAAHQAATSILSRWGGKVAELADRVPAVGHLKRGMQKAMAAVKGKLADRYGDKAANVIMASGSVGGYGVMALSIKTLGFTLPVVTDVVSIVGHVAVAEGLYQLGILKGKRHQAVANLLWGLVVNEMLSEEDIHRISKKVWKYLGDQYAKIVSKYADDLEGLTTNVGKCEPGQTAAATGCTPATGGGEKSSKPQSTQESKPGTPEHIKGTIRKLLDTYGSKLNDPTKLAAVMRTGDYPHMTPAGVKFFLDSMNAGHSRRGAEHSRRGAQHSDEKAPPKPTTPKSAAKEISALAQGNRFGLVAVHELHDALGRPNLGEFHKTLMSLWRSGAISLHEHEGRHGITDREQETALVVPSSRSHGLGSRMVYMTVENPDLLKKLAM